ncbi:MAG: zinc ABC transporter substrate-binding protein, partial [Clostridia bacterium]|nr:zinc ABC transporter substrate-binding protein [Clostridia bacterium]
LNVVGTCEGVTVSCLTRPQAGCLHDYQLSPAERAALDEADVLLQNGAGMESFLGPALESLSGLTVIDTSAGLDLLTCEAHEHGHDHHHSVNAHLWVDPALYAEQVKRVRDGLCAVDSAHAAEYTANAEAYLQKIAAVEQQLNEISLPHTHALLFHESVAYAAKALQLETVGIVPLGENEAASAGDLAEIADALKGKAVLLLYDTQYTALYESLAQYADKAAIVHWDTAVQPINGVAAKDAWLVAMRQNINALKEAAA